MVSNLPQKKITELAKRIENLQTKYVSNPDSTTEGLAAVLAELKVNVEDLSAAYDELMQQNALKVSEEALQKQQNELEVRNQQLQALFDYSSASLVLFDARPPYTVLAHNKYYQELWNEPFRTEGMVGKNLLDYAPNVKAAGVMAVFDEVVQTKRAKNLLSFPYEGMPRGRTWWNWHLSPIIQDDQVIALVHVGFDVTNEVKARQIVQEERDRLSALISSISDEVWFADTLKQLSGSSASALMER